MIQKRMSAYCLFIVMSTIQTNARMHQIIRRHHSIVLRRSLYIPQNYLTPLIGLSALAFVIGSLPDALSLVDYLFSDTHRLCSEQIAVFYNKYNALESAYDMTNPCYYYDLLQFHNPEHYVSWIKKQETSAQKLILLPGFYYKPKGPAGFLYQSIFSDRRLICAIAKEGLTTLYSMKATFEMIDESSNFSDEYLDLLHNNCPNEYVQAWCPTTVAEFYSDNYEKKLFEAQYLLKKIASSNRIPITTAEENLAEHVLSEISTYHKEGLERYQGFNKIYMCYKQWKDAY